MKKHFRRSGRQRLPWRQRWVARLLSLPAPLLRLAAGKAAGARDPLADGLDPALRVLCRVASRRARFHELTPQAARVRHGAIDALLPKAQALMDRVEEKQIPGPGGRFGVRIYTPADLRADPPALVYFHGGGWVLGDLDGCDAWCRLIAGQTPCKVFSVDYRLAPEHPYPAAVEDAVAAYRWVRGEAAALRLDARRIAVGGDSAGGNLAAVVSASCAADERPCGQLLVYPVTSADRDTESYETFAEGYGLSRATMDYFFEHYLSGAEAAGSQAGLQARDPRISPLHGGDLAALPSSIVVTAGYDVLRDEGIAYAERLREAGVPVAHLHFPSLMHSFANASGLEAPRRALDDIVGELATLFHDLG